jgi:hypothetical protein
MTARDFCFWLQGKLEIDAAKLGPVVGEYTEGLTASQVEVIKKHLAMVFVHEIDPSMGGPEQQAKLNDLHAIHPHPMWGERPRC